MTCNSGEGLNYSVNAYVKKEDLRNRTSSFYVKKPAKGQTKKVHKIKIRVEIKIIENRKK